ncbi:DUF6615 family protein [Lysinibacillus sp. IITD104]|uniref:DUF6615 family protein n=1 Tax=Lysinibacillus sp. IITD104 TaxID=3116650 RepID=UPI002FD10815
MTSCTCKNVLKLEKIIEERMDYYKSGGKYNEPSLTEEIVYQIQKNCSDARLIHSTSEATTGADIEWWIEIYQDCYIGLNIQAKKRYKDSIEYDKIAHKIGGHTPQIDRLINYSNTRRMIPLYCFYNFVGKTIKNSWTFSFAEDIKYIKSITTQYKDPIYLQNNNALYEMNSCFCDNSKINDFINGSGYKNAGYERPNYQDVIKNEHQLPVYVLKKQSKDNISTYFQDTPIPKFILLTKIKDKNI